MQNLKEEMANRPPMTHFHLIDKVKLAKLREALTKEMQTLAYVYSVHCPDTVAIRMNIPTKNSSAFEAQISDKAYEALRVKGGGKSVELGLFVEEGDINGAVQILLNEAMSAGNILNGNDMRCNLPKSDFPEEVFALVEKMGGKSSWRRPGVNDLQKLVF